MFLIDFAPAAHGHFLQYVINNYIFNINCKFDIFSASGAAHNTEYNSDYNVKSIIDYMHCSSYDQLIPKRYQKIVYIKHDIRYDYIMLYNSYDRCHGFLPSNSQKELINAMHDDILSEPNDIRRRANWYSKLMNRSGFLTDQVSKQINTDKPVYKFKYSSFFDVNLFYAELQQISKFFADTFTPDDSLAHLHQKFLDKNDGYSSYKKCMNILESIHLNQDTEITTDWKEEAFLNYNLTKIYRIHSGDLFNNDYPRNTKIIYNIVQEHLRLLDKNL